MSFLLGKPCKTDRTWSITASPQVRALPSGWVSWAWITGVGAFPWLLVQVQLEGCVWAGLCLLGISFRDQFAAVLFPTAWQETVYVMLSRGVESCSGVPRLTMSSWSHQQVVVLVCSVSLWHSPCWGNFPLKCSSFHHAGDFLAPPKRDLQQWDGPGWGGQAQYPAEGHDSLSWGMYSHFSLFPAWEWCQEESERSWEVGLRSVHQAAARQAHFRRVTVQCQAAPDWLWF